MRHREKIKIIWALENFSFQEKLCQTAENFLNQFSVGRNDIEVVIEPVYFLTPDLLDLSSNFHIPDLIKKKNEFGKKLLKKIKLQENQTLCEPKVLVQVNGTSSHPLGSLQLFARDAKADFILVTTHGRTGFSRLITSSFLEHLILHAGVPVLSITPDSENLMKNNSQSGDIDRLFFTTDLSVESYHSFHHAIQIAKKLNLKMTLFHACLGDRKNITRCILTAQEKLKKWVFLAECSGVKCEERVDICPTRSDTDLNHEILKIMMDLQQAYPRSIVALSTHSRVLEPRSRQSLSRRLIHGGVSPLLIFHEEHVGCVDSNVDSHDLTQYEVI